VLRRLLAKRPDRTGWYECFAGRVIKCGAANLARAGYGQGYERRPPLDAVAPATFVYPQGPHDTGRALAPRASQPKRSSANRPATKRTPEACRQNFQHAAAWAIPGPPMQKAYWDRFKNDTAQAALNSKQTIASALDSPFMGH